MNKQEKNRSFFFRHGLTLVFFALFIFSWAGQAWCGLKEYNDERTTHGEAPLPLSKYFHTGHFIQSTFENWESEFLQMALFVILTIFLREKGSSESKDCDAPFFDRSQLEAKEDSPWPVRKGGVYLAIYKNSLSIVLMLLFIFSFVMHLYGSFLDQREKSLREGEIPENLSGYLSSSRLWFESFQNWQSEFLSVFAIIFLSIYLRQIGSSQSKAVNDPNDKTGSD